MTHESTATRRPKARDQLAALYEVSSALLDTRDVDQILQLVCDHAVDLLRASGSVVTQFDDTGTQLVHLRCSGSLSDTCGFRFPVAGSLNGRAATTREPVIENDVAQSPGASVARDVPAHFTRGVTVPLVCRGEVLGTLACVADAAREPFDEGDAKVLLSFANSAALAIEIARTYAREQQRQEEHIQRLVTLHEADVAVSADLDLEELLQRIVEEARRLTHARYGALGVLDESGEALAKFVTAGVTPEERARMGSLPTGQGLLGEVIRQGRTLRVAVALEHPQSGGVPDGHPPVTSFLGVPVRIRNKAYGNLYLTNKEDAEEFSEQDARLLEMLAVQAGAAIENADLFAQRNRLIEELERARRVRNRLQAYVHHDIRNALHGISLWAERLMSEDDEGGEPAPETVEIAGKIGRGSRHALRLVSDVLDLTRLEEGRLQTWPRRVSMRELVGAASDAVLPDADRRSVELVTLPLTHDVDFVADPDRVLQIVINLLGNAVKFTREGSRVEIGARRSDKDAAGRDGDWVVIWVRDQGPGIAEEDRDRIFDGFERLAPDTRKAGSGLGLTLSRMLAAYLGGALTLESTVGEGSTFSLWIPADAEPERREGWIG